MGAGQPEVGPRRPLWESGPGRAGLGGQGRALTSDTRGRLRLLLPPPARPGSCAMARRLRPGPRPPSAAAVLAAMRGLDRNSGNQPVPSAPTKLAIASHPIPNSVPCAALPLKLSVKGADFKCPAWRGDLVPGGRWTAVLGDCRKSTLPTAPCAGNPEGPARQ